LLEDDVAAGCARIGRPTFARLQASIAEQQLDWAWQPSSDSATPRGERERSGARITDAGVSTRALWLGGILFVLVAAGVIAAVATVQSSLPVPFETWARRDLMQRADGSAAVLPYDTTAGLAGVGTARPESVPAPAVAEHVPAEIDAALGAPGRLEPSDIDIAGVGPILGSAATSKEFAARLATGSLPRGHDREPRRAPAPRAAPAGLQTDPGVLTRRTGGAGAPCANAVTPDLAREPSQPGADLERIGPAGITWRLSACGRGVAKWDVAKPPVGCRSAGSRLKVRSERPPEVGGGSAQTADLPDADQRRAAHPAGEQILGDRIEQPQPPACYDLPARRDRGLLLHLGADRRAAQDHRRSARPLGWVQFVAGEQVWGRILLRRLDGAERCQHQGDEAQGRGGCRQMSHPCLLDLCACPSR
jgi:hypothetical protein